MQDILLVIDMQTDFVDGALGTAEAVRIVPAVAARIDEAIARGEQIYFTRDTHQANYLATPEGRKLPVIHCVQGTPGWRSCWLRPTRRSRSVGSLSSACALISV